MFGNISEITKPINCGGRWGRALSSAPAGATALRHFLGEPATGQSHTGCSAAGFHFEKLAHLNVGIFLLQEKSLGNVLRLQSLILLWVMIQSLILLQAMTAFSFQD